ncbi:hypothetical protein GCM10027414_19080 [Humibacter ginsengiterrae]
MGEAGHTAGELHEIAEKVSQFGFAARLIPELKGDRFGKHETIIYSQAMYFKSCPPLPARLRVCADATCTTASVSAYA